MKEKFDKNQGLLATNAENQSHAMRIDFLRNTLGPKQSDRHFDDNIFIFIFLWKMFHSDFKFPRNLLPKCNQQITQECGR